MFKVHQFLLLTNLAAFQASGSACSLTVIFHSMVNEICGENICHHPSLQ